MEDPDNSSSITTPGGCATFTFSNSGIHAGAFGTRWSAIAFVSAAERSAAAGILQEVKRQETGGDPKTLRPRCRRHLAREKDLGIRA